MTSERILVVDLDGTLIRSDMLYETFWSAFASHWAAPLSAAGSLLKGRAALKRRMAELGPVDAAALPYNEDVLELVKAWRKGGGKAALVTASDHEVACAVAAHLGIFDEVHGSAGGTNLTGDRKAAFLSDRFGAGKFAYAGNAAADLPVWQAAGKALVVDAPAAVAAKVEAMGRDAERIALPPRPARAYLRALRPHQWLKNTLVFLPMLAAHDLSVPAFTASLLAFVAFCLVASGVYVMNDLLDLAADRAHPRKKNRPLASGALPISHGTVMAPLLLFAGLAAGLALGAGFALVLLGYFALTTVYSLALKRMIVIDICTLAGLYTLRIVAGSAATGIELSVWLLTFSIFFFFALATVKRQAELVDGVATGKVTSKGRGYHVDDLPLVASMAAASGYVSVMVMALYLNSPDVLALYALPYVLWGIIPVLLYWISRMVMVTHRGGMHDDPVVYAARDPASLVCFALIVGFATAGAIL